MTGLIRSEFFRILHSGLLLALTLVIIIMSAFFNSRSHVSAQNVYDLSEICTYSEFSLFCQDKSLSPESIKATMIHKGYIESSDATTILGVYQDIQPHQFKLLLISLKGTLFVPIVFICFFLIMDVKGKSYFNALYSGRSRTAVYISKAIFYLVMAFIISLLSIMLMTLFYAGSVYSSLPFNYVWGCFLLYALINTAILAVPFMLTFIIRRPVLSALAVIIYSLLVRYTSQIMWPASLQTNIDLWSRSAASGLIGMAVLASAVFIIVSFLIGLFVFNKVELK